MHTFLRKLGAAAILVALTTVALAHDFWIRPSQFQADKNARLSIDLRVGEHLIGDPVSRNADKLARFVAVHASGREEAIVGIDGRAPAGFVRASEPGLLWIGYESNTTPIELAALRHDAEWSSRWQPALREHPAGRPVPYGELPESSETLIQTVHHILRLEQLSGRAVCDWRVIVEFGGGFGGMCRAMHTLGFRGRYLIFDLPHIVVLQRYYLERVGLMSAGDERVRATSDFTELETFVESIRGDEPALFLATWSLSETPVALRERIKPIVQRIGNYFLAYQGRYCEVDNVDYFSNHWVDVASRHERIAHRPDDYYAASAASTDAQAKMR